MPASQVEAILIHELAHIRRRDYLANLLQTVGGGFPLLSSGGLVDLQRDPRGARKLL